MPRRSVVSGARWMPGDWRACLSGWSDTVRGACLGDWRACLGGRLVHARGIRPAVLPIMPAVLPIMPRRSADLRVHDHAWGAGTHASAADQFQCRGACLGCGRSCLVAGQWEGMGPPAPPNPVLQLTASRARSLVFYWSLMGARSRHLNTKPFGRTINAWCCLLTFVGVRTVVIKHAAIRVCYTTRALATTPNGVRS